MAYEHTRCENGVEIGHGFLQKVETTMGHSNLNLAALIGSRICHDLISPVGAIHNGLELLEMSGEVSGPEMGLIAESVTNAEARIRYFRLAYGAASDQQIARSEMVGLLRDISAGGRVTIDWAPFDGTSRRDVRLALLAVQCLETAMPFGGTIRIQQSGKTWSVEGEAERMSVEPKLWNGLTDLTAQPEITPALVQFAILPFATEDAGRSLDIDATATRITISF